jgi:hypothetical protein
MAAVDAAESQQARCSNDLAADRLVTGERPLA